MEHTAFSIVNLPKLPPEACITSNEVARVQAEKTREIRLRALTIAPEAFASSYELEVQRDLEHTLNRLKTAGADHFFAVDPFVTADPAWPAEQVWRSLAQVEFLAMIVLIGPVEGGTINASRDPLAPLGTRSHEDTTPGESVDSVSGANPMTLHYHLNGVFVDPKCRRRGVGERLIAAALKKAQAEAAKHGRHLRCSILVDSENHAAEKLYEKAGFVVVGDEKYVQQPRTQMGELAARERLALRMEMERSTFV